jgi:hypothetical protein
MTSMVADPYVALLPALTGGNGAAEVEDFYQHHFIFNMPPDMELVPVNRIIGGDYIVEESVFRFTHTVELDWMLPGLAPTGKRVEIAVVSIVKMAGEGSRTSTLGPGVGARAARTARHRRCRSSARTARADPRPERSGEPADEAPAREGGSDEGKPIRRSRRSAAASTTRSSTPTPTSSRPCRCCSTTSARSAAVLRPSASSRSCATSAARSR